MWIQHTNAQERRALVATFSGYALDGFDFMMYTFLIPTLMSAWSMSKAEAGTIATGALLSSSLGGWVAGILADRFGRVKVLQWTVLWFSGFTCLCGFTHSFSELLLARTAQGFGMGGEWAVGSVLIAETIQAEFRGKAAGLVQSSWAVGWALAAGCFALASGLLPPELAWKCLFWVGITPALLLLYIRRKVKEPPVFQQRPRTPSGLSFLGIFSPRLLKTTLLASLLATGMQGAYYSVTTWLPTFLKTERHLTVLNTSGYLLVLIAGSFAGYLCSGWWCDRIGRRRAFMSFAVVGGALVLAYTQWPITDAQMLVLGFPLGFFVSGIFSGMGAYLSELFPNDVRGSGQGFCYNVGRALASICTLIIGVLSSHGASLGTTLGLLAAACYLLVIASAFFLPETHARALTEPYGDERASPPSRGARP